MEWRGLAVLVALVVIGAGTGYAMSVQDYRSVGSGVADPVAAEGPSLPVDPPTQAAEDPDDLPLEPGIAMTAGSLGAGDFMITFPVPAGWRTNTNATNEAKWKRPGTSNDSYVMRIEQITSQDVTIEQAVDNRVARLYAEQTGVEILDRGPNSLEYTYRSNEGNARQQLHALGRHRRRRPGRRGDRGPRPRAGRARHERPGRARRRGPAGQLTQGQLDCLRDTAGAGGGRGPHGGTGGHTADDHLRHGLLTWVPVPSTATAQVEVAISGRQVDVPGMQT